MSDWQAASPEGQAMHLNVMTLENHNLYKLLGPAPPVQL